MLNIESIETGLINLKKAPYFYLFFCIILIGLTPYAVTTKGEIHLWINQFHHPLADAFFRYFTFMGDGVFILICSLMLLLFKIRWGITALLSYLSSGVIAQVLKRFVFSDLLRPTAFFENENALYIIENFTPHKHHTFPSGHSATAFAFFILICIWSKQKFIKSISFCVAILVAYSRVYLSEHFLIDVLIGSSIGYLCGTYANNYICSLKYDWLNRRLFQKK